MLDVTKLKKAQEGDLKSIEDICSATWEPLYRFIYFKVQNREEAEDITQETYVKAFSYMQKGSIEPEKYINFLKTVALNVLRDRWRKNKRLETRESLNNFETIDLEKSTMEDLAETSVRRALIENALKMLGEEQQTVIELRIIKGYSTAETARIMNKKEGAVRVMQYRALKALAAILKGNG